MFEEKFRQLVEEFGGFEFYQAYRGDVDHILGGKGDTFWYTVMKKGKVTESYIGELAGGIWSDKYIKISGSTKKEKVMPAGSTIRLIAERRIWLKTSNGSQGAPRSRLKTRIRTIITYTVSETKRSTYR